MENQRSNTTNYRLFQLDRQYKSSTNFIKYIEEAQNFYNGDQYPNNNKENQVRIQVNLCSQCAIVKASKICGTPIYLTYTASDNKTDCTALQRFDEYNRSKLQDKSANYQSALNGFVNGTEIFYYRWDDDDTTYKGIYKGGLQGEHIDIKKFAVANPFIRDIQNQAWVMFWDDYALEGVKTMVEGKSKAEIDAKIKLLQCRETNDVELSDTDKDNINHALVTVFTRFFRINGEVYFMCSTRDVDLFECPHPLSRKVAKNTIENIVKKYKEILKDESKDTSLNKIVDYQIDYEDLVLQASKNKEFTKEEYANIKEKFSLYPFAVFRPFFINGSFYGRSDIKSLIRTQKGINFLLSMNLKCAENNAYNKIFVKPDTLGGQKITNQPGQVIVDHSPFTNGWGIKVAESQPTPNGLIESADKLYSMTRVVHGFSEVMTGDVTNQDLSGYMVNQMIKQNNTSIEQQQQLFWTFNEDKAAIRLMFYKHYVDKAKYTYEIDINEYDDQEMARQRLLEKANKKGLETMPNATGQDFSIPTHRIKIGTLKNDDIYGVDFDITIDAMQGLNDSKLVEQQAWTDLITNGGLMNMNPDQLELLFTKSPLFSERTKVAMKGALERQKMSIITQLTQQLAKSQQIGQQAVAYGKQLEDRLGMQSQYLKALESEFGQKINAQNQIIQGLTKEVDKTRGQTMEQGEVKSNNALGISGGHSAPQQ